MRVGLVCPYSLDVPGGVQSHVRDLARGLMARGHEVRLLAPGAADGSRPSYVHTVGPAVPIPYNGSVARLAFGPRAALRTRAWLRHGDFDVVHVHEPTTPSLSLLTVWASDRPIVATFHTALGRSAATASFGGVLRPAVQRIAAQIAVSEAARRSMAARLPGDPVIVPNGIDYASFSTASPRRRWTTPGPTIAFLGRWDEPRKGLRVLLDAFGPVREAFPTARVLVGGPGRARARTSLLPTRGSARCCPTVCARRSHGSSVEFLGPLSDSDRSALLASADVFVAPNTGGESFGIILVEAMAAGAPVVASDLPAFAAVLDGGRSGRLFGTGDAQAAAAAIIELLADADAASVLRARGQAAAKAYDWSRVVPAIESVYEQAMLGPG
jgi:phosphatidylinositol alpha-mannosyltransferase